MDFLVFIISIAIGFLVVHLTSGKVEGRIGMGILLFKTKYHIYHSPLDDRNNYFIDCGLFKIL